MRYSDKYSIYVHTGHSNDLHLPQTNLAVYQTGVYYSGVKTCNNIPSDIINNSRNPKRFKIFFDYTLSFNTIGGILFRTTHGVEDSFLIQFQVLFKLLFNF